MANTLAKVETWINNQYPSKVYLTGARPNPKKMNAAKYDAYQSIGTICSRPDDRFVRLRCSMQKNSESGIYEVSEGVRISQDSPSKPVEIRYFPGTTPDLEAIEMLKKDLLEVKPLAMDTREEDPLASREAALNSRWSSRREAMDTREDDPLEKENRELKRALSEREKEIRELKEPVDARAAPASNVYAAPVVVAEQSEMAMKMMARLQLGSESAEMAPPPEKRARADLLTNPFDLLLSSV